jgi:hypothetical protein
MLEHLCSSDKHDQPTLSKVIMPHCGVAGHYDSWRGCHQGKQLRCGRGGRFTHLHARQMRTMRVYATAALLQGSDGQPEGTWKEVHRWLRRADDGPVLLVLENVEDVLRHWDCSREVRVSAVRCCACEACLPLGVDMRTAFTELTRGTSAAVLLRCCMRPRVDMSRPCVQIKRFS